MPTTTQTLAAGSDVTLLAVGTSAGNVVSMVSDDNRLLPTTSANVKLRLVNAMNGMDAYPLNLSLNLGPVASAVLPGRASAYSADFAATTAGILSVTSAYPTVPTGTPLLRLTDQTLLKQGVYSVFMFGTGAAPTGLLVPERLAP